MLACFGAFFSQSPSAGFFLFFFLLWHKHRTRGRKCIRWASWQKLKTWKDFSSSFFTGFLGCLSFDRSLDTRERNNNKNTKQSLNVWHDRSPRASVLVACYGILHFYLLFSFLVCLRSWRLFEAILALLAHTLWSINLTTIITQSLFQLTKSHADEKK